MQFWKTFDNAMTLVGKQRSVIAQQEAKIRDLTDKQHCLSNDHQVTRALVGQRNVEIEALKETLKGTEAALADRSTDVEWQRKRIEELRTQVGKLTVALCAADVVVAKKNKEIENLKYKLQLNRDEVGRMAVAVNLNHAEITRLKDLLQRTSDQLSQKLDNERLLAKQIGGLISEVNQLRANENVLAEAHAKVCAENTRLREELADAELRVDPYYEARFRNEVAKTQELSQKVWEQDGELETLRKGYDELAERYKKDAALWTAGLVDVRLQSNAWLERVTTISELSDKFASEDLAMIRTGLTDLHERVSTLEKAQWQEGEGG